MGRGGRFRRFYQAAESEPIGVVVVLIGGTTLLNLEATKFRRIFYHVISGRFLRMSKRHPNPDDHGGENTKRVK